MDSISTSNRTVAILGAGPCGLSAAKFARERGLLPTVYDKSSSPGGIWAPVDNSPVWEGLRSLTSRYGLRLIDHEWPENATLYPSSKEIYNYIMSYVDKYQIDQYLNLNTLVEKVNQTNDKRWEVDTLNLKTNERASQVFDFLIVATGLQNEPRIPKYENSENFKGLQIHSVNFRLNDNRFKDKKVIVVGCGTSGSDVSACLVNHAKSVLNVYNRQYLVGPRLTLTKLNEKNEEGKELYKIIPADLVLFSRNVSSITKDPNIPIEAKIAGRNHNISTYFPIQTKRESGIPEIFVDLNDDGELLFAMSEKYIEGVKQNKIIPKKTQIKRFESNGVYLADGSFEEADVVIYATGYDFGLTHFFSSQILEKLKYDTTDYRYPIILYKYTFHPEIENMALLGQTEGLTIPGGQLQALWICSVFSGEIKLPSREVMETDIKDEEAKRSAVISRKPQWPYGTFTDVIDSIANEMGLLPNFDELKIKDHKLYHYLWNNSIITSHFTYMAFPEMRDVAIKSMEEVDFIVNQKYTFENEDNITYADMVKKLNNHFITEL